MNWGNIMEKTVNKPMNIYESSLFNDYLETNIKLSDQSKSVYRGYLTAIAKWIRLHNYTTIGTTEIATEYLKWKKEQSSPKQANCRHRIMNGYCEWLMQNGKLSNNPWKNVDLKDLGISNEDVQVYVKAYRKAKKEAATKNTQNDTAVEIKEKRTFTLSDIALLLMAIEDGDEGQVVEILEGGIKNEC